MTHCPPAMDHENAFAHLRRHRMEHTGTRLTSNESTG